MPRSKSELATIVREHLQALAAGKCSLTPEQVEEEEDPDLQGVLQAVLELSRAQAAHAERERQRRLQRAILDNLPIVSFLKDSEGRFVHLSRSAEAVLKAPAEDFIGLTDYDMFSADVADRLRATDRQVLREGRLIFEEEKLHVTADGTTYMHYAGKLPLHLEETGETFLLGFSFNIDERKRLERDLVEQREFIQCVLDTDPNLIFVKDRHGNFLFVNQAVARLFGKRPEELVNASNYAVHAPRDEVEIYNETDARVLRNLETVTLEEPFTRPDGELRWFQTYKAPLRRADGELCVLGISVDVTERKRVEESLKEQKDFLQTVIDTLPDVVFAKDRDTRLTLINDAFCQLMGIRKEDALGKSAFDLHAPEIAARFAAEDQALFRAGDMVRVEERVIGRKDHIRLFDTIKVVHRNAEGEVIGLIGVGRDITERKKVEDELVSAKEQAEAATVAKSQFLANISHEIRTPLNGIIGMTSLLLTTALDAEQKDYVETIQASGSTLLTLINDILDFSKMESEHLVLDAQPFDLARCVARAISMSAPLAREKGLHLVTALAADLPAHVVGDEVRLCQVLGNLINNAVKFTDRGEVALTVRARAGVGDALDLAFEVRDTGIGIPADKLDTLFERFTQVDNSTTRRYGGSGLGLAISKWLVERMGGRIQVESTVGAGSIFSFDIRATLPAEEHLQQIALLQRMHGKSQAHDASHAPARALRILIAEDNLINRKVAVGLLDQLGYAADVAANGVEVLEALAQRPYDIVFMDLHMPIMDGLATTRAILARWPQGARPVVIAMTADAMQGDRERCLAAGMQDYVSKPVSLESLGAALARWGRVAPPAPTRVAPAAPAPAAPAPAAPDPDCIDREIFQTYGPELMHELLQTFIATVPPRIAAMRRLTAPEHVSELSLEAHTLKGAGLNMGANRFAAVCRTIEEQGRRGETAGLDALLAQLEQSYEQSRAALETILARARAS